jgi:hypothetical protein
VVGHDPALLVAHHPLLLEAGDQPIDRRFEVTAVDSGAKEVTVKDLSSGKPLAIRVTADSHVKRMLDREGMIKMPLNLDPRKGTDWKATLNVALDKLTALDGRASVFRAETNRYIRPIMLIQVERTGRDQRASGHIHADDVKEWLLTAGFDEAEIAIKTAEQNDLRGSESSRGNDAT